MVLLPRWPALPGRVPNSGPETPDGASSSSRPSVTRPRQIGNKLRFLTGAFSAYKIANQRYPAATRIGTAVAILGFGDVSAQKMQHARERAAGDVSNDNNIDLRRLAAMCSFGAIYTGWFQMHWFRVLQKAFPPVASKVLGSGPILSRIPMHVVAPLFLNQMCAVPALYYPFYFGWTGAIRSRGLGESMEAMKEAMPRVLLQNWSIWIPAQAVQFAIVPPSYHILYVSAVGLVWSSVLSYTTQPAAAMKTATAARA